MNPVTRSLLQRLKNRRLEEFVTYWDALERMVIRVYKGKRATAEDEAEYERLRRGLQKHYPRWEKALRPYWQGKQAGGEPVREDPFLALFSVPQASGFIQNWTAMQTLPAAREAINEYIVAQIG